ncbi:MAG: hypothetical protein KAR14_01510 [Candidatus Aminicenantes bacterium]|nr:hypothetical protein [Candidatus Aminicenantes bacterium]
MKRVIQLLLIVIFSGMFFLTITGNDVREELEVINIEIPVRVLHKGKPVNNLIKSDFSLFENGKKIDINGFNVVRNKIKKSRTGLTKKTDIPERNRLFVIAFSLTDFHRSYEDGVKYLFDRVLKDDDSLIFMINNVIFTYNDLKNRKYIFGKILKTLRAEGRKARANIRGVFKSIELSLNMLKSELAITVQKNTNTPGDVSSGVKSSMNRKHTLFFLRTYKSAWDDFKGRFLFINIDPFYNLSKFLKGLNYDKWAINFYQIEKFPMLDPMSEIYSKIIQNSGVIGSRILKDIQREFDAETGFPADEVGKMFLSGGVRFDMVLVPSRIESDSSGIVSGDVSTSIENTLRKITKMTGGRTTFSADIKKTFKEMEEREDIVYMLTFAPADSRETGKIKIKLRNKKYKILYDKNVRSGFIKRYIGKKESEKKDVTIQEVIFSERILSVKINDFVMKKTGEKMSGNMVVNVVIKNDRGEFIFEKEEHLYPDYKAIDIQFDLRNLNVGKYDVLVDVNDVNSGGTAFKYTRIKTKKNDQVKVQTAVSVLPVSKKNKNIVKDDDRIILNKILSGCASYCSKLKSSAFHFFCTEKIVSSGNEIVLSKYKYRRVNRRKFSNKYFFDYQLINDSSGVREQRRIISKRGKADDEDIHQMPISFLSEKVVFAPSMILGEEEQKKFSFKMNGLKREGGNEFVVLEAIPLKPKKIFFKEALIYVDAKNYSIRKIIVIPRYIRGYKSLMRTAFYYKSRLFLDCKIEFNKEYKGLWFPTYITIREIYKGGRFVIQNMGTTGWEKSRTTFRYDDYKFFNVDMDIKN